MQHHDQEQWNSKSSVDALCKTKADVDILVNTPQFFTPALVLHGPDAVHIPAFYLLDAHQTGHQTGQGQGGSEAAEDERIRSC